MSRVKGWYEEHDLKYPYEEQSCLGTRIYVEEIPPDAIRVEAVVEVDPYENNLHYVCVDIDEYRHLPQFDKGKRVQVIIFEEEI